MAIAIVILAVALALSGCDGSQDLQTKTTETKTTETNTVETKTVEAKPAKVKPATTVDSATVKTVAISNGGVGGIRTGTPFTQQALSAALPNLTVTRGTGSTEGEAYPIFLAKDRGGRHVLTVTPDASRKKVYAVQVISSQIPNTLGHPIGARWKDVFQGDDTSHAQPGMEEMSGKVIARVEGANAISYVFSGQKDGPDGTVPPAKVLRDWTLTSIVWTAR